MAADGTGQPALAGPAEHRAAARDPHPPASWAPLLVTLFVQLAVSFAATAPLAISVAIADSLRIDHALIGLYSALLYGAAIGGTLAGPWAMRRVPSVRLMVLCMLVNAMGLALFAQIGDALVWGLAGNIVMGLAYGMVAPVTAVTLNEGFSARAQPLIVSIKQTGVPLGTALSAAVLPALALAQGWRWTLGVAVGLTGAAALALALLPARRAGPPPPAQSGSSGAALAAVWRAPAARAMALACFCLGANQAAAISLLIPTLVSHHGMGLRQAAALLAVTTVAGAIARIVVGASATRFGHPLGHVMVLASLGTLAWALLLAQGAVAHPAVQGLAAVLLGFAAIGWNGVLLSQMTLAGPRAQAAAFNGVGTALAYAGVVSGPLVHATLWSATGSPALAIMAVASLGLAGAVILGLGTRRLAAS